MRNNIIGRVSECERLEACLNSTQAQLIVVCGRRGIGKTFLIDEFFGRKFTFKITGVYDKAKDIQLRSFTAELIRKTGEKWKTPKNWTQAFDHLRTYPEQLDALEKQIVFFDEMPWLDTRRSDFRPAFERFWNDWGSARHNLVFIICGSAVSWLDKTFSEKGGLFNRETCQLSLKPFTLHETECFLHSRDITWPRDEIAECYMIMGGIPSYLKALDGKYTPAQNIDCLFFSPHGEFRNELYNALFPNSHLHIRIAGALSTKRGGLSRSEICQQTGISDNGALTKALANLIAVGFIRSNRFYGKKAKDTRYQLSDHYSLFYFRLMNDTPGEDPHDWHHCADLPARRVWSELAYESLCLEHLPQIKQKLGISGVSSEESVWSSPGNEELGISAAQVDLLIERRDRIICLCEIEYSAEAFVIDRAIDLALRNKTSAFKAQTKTKKSIQLILLTTHGVKKNLYSGIAQNQVTLDDLFRP